MIPQRAAIKRVEQDEELRFQPGELTDILSRLFVIYACLKNATTTHIWNCSDLVSFAINFAQNYIYNLKRFQGLNEKGNDKEKRGEEGLRTLILRAKPFRRGSNIPGNFLIGTERRTRRVIGTDSPQFRPRFPKIKTDIPPADADSLSASALRGRVETSTPRPARGGGFGFCIGYGEVARRL